MIIVMNTLRVAVSEWDAPISSVSGDTAAGDRLFSIAGDTDDGAEIDARWLTPQTDQGTSQRKSVPFIYFEMGDSAGDALVVADGEEYDYPVEARDDGISRARPGMGIRAHRLAFGFRNTDGGDFRIESMEPITNASTRRIA